MRITSSQQLSTYQEICRISTEILRQLYESAVVGKTPLEIDQLAFQLCKKYEVEPAFFGVPGYRSEYRYATCTYVNDVTVHGIPKKEELKPGDLVTVDFGIVKEGLFTDHCVTVGIEKVTGADLRLLEVGRASVWNAVQLATANNSVGDLGDAMESTAQKAGFDTIKEYIGHGIGRTLHDDPEIPAHGRKGTGVLLDRGMVICVEDQVVAGKPGVYLDNDGWSVRTDDGKNSVMFEYMVVVEKDAPIVLTPTHDWELVH